MRTEDLLKNTSAFIPTWHEQWQPDPRMLNFEEKWSSFHTPDGRLMTCAHRGDRNEYYYPENSIEAFLSAIMAGADILEADIHTTADGTLVVMHDDTVTRCTNVSALREAGEAWMPQSDVISDWSLEQLRRLRLVKQSDRSITEYAIPTLRELILVAKDRAFITLDKTHKFDWRDVDALIDELDAYRTVLIPYNYSLTRVLSIRTEQLMRSGRACPFFAHIGSDCGAMSPEKMQTVPSFLAEHGMSPILRGGEYIREEREALSPYIAPLKDTHRIYAETLKAPHDDREHWEEMLKIGYNIIMGNKIYDIVKMVKDKYFSE